MKVKSEHCCGGNDGSDGDDDGDSDGGDASEAVVATKQTCSILISGIRKFHTNLRRNSMTGEQLLSLQFDEISPSSILEKYTLTGSDAIIQFSAGTHIVLNVEEQENVRPRDRDSSRVYTHVLSEYKWASEECYNGRILAVHENLIAYRLFNESTGEAVRVLERTTSKRHLIKSFKHPTADLQWAHHAPLLAVIDVNANLYVYHVDKECTVTKYLNVIRKEKSVPVGVTPRISWCPYIPDADDPHDETHMIAVYFGSTVEAISLNVIKSELHCEEVTLEQCETLSDAIMKLPIEDANTEVQTVCLSPDATAIAVAHDGGIVTFFILDNEGTKFAHRWQPEHGRHIQDLVFLDNIAAPDTSLSEQFWKYAVISTEGGKRIQLYDTENWNCIARLLFEPLDHLGKLALSVHPTAKYIFLTDYDAANIYCIEIAYTLNVPRFVACTQVTFCHPLVTIVPISVAQIADDIHQDFALTDEEISPADVLVSFVALSQRSLLHLEIGLEMSHMLNGSAAADSGASAIGGGAAGAGGGDNIEQAEVNSVSNVDIADNSNNKPNGEDREQHERGNPEALETVYRHLESLSLRLEKQSEEFEKRLQEERERTDAQMRQLREDIVSCDERLFLKLESLINDSRTSTVEAMQTSLDLKMDGVIQNLRATTATANFKQSQEMDARAVREEMTKYIRDMMMITVVPVLQDMCVSLFQQLNETFRAGLEQYMRQIQALCSGSLKAAAAVAARTANDSLLGNSSSFNDTAALIKLIESQRFSAAFEKAIAQKDFAALMFVCNNVDPEMIGGVDQPLPQNILLCLLNHLGAKLDGETDLKFRYIENALMALQVRDPSIAGSFRHVLNRLQTSLTAYMATDASPSLKRRARIISQLAANLLR